MAASSKAVAVVGHHSSAGVPASCGPHGIHRRLCLGLGLGVDRFGDVGGARGVRGDVAASSSCLSGKCSPDGVQRLLMLVLYGVLTTWKRGPH